MSDSLLNSKLSESEGPRPGPCKSPGRDKDPPASEPPESESADHPDVQPIASPRLKSPPREGVQVATYSYDGSLRAYRPVLRAGVHHHNLIAQPLDRIQTPAQRLFLVADDQGDG